MSVHLRRLVGANPVARMPSGTYRRARPNAHSHGMLSCPTCGETSTISRRVHSVADDGTVTPSYVCPYPPCTFHAFVVLDDWSLDDAALMERDRG